MSVVVSTSAVCCLERYVSRKICCVSKLDVTLNSFTFFLLLPMHEDAEQGSYRSWKVLEFNVEIFKALKSLEMIIGMEKSGKILENCNVDLENKRCLLHC